ncbi:MAG: 3-isopropylmalate dehydratase small subunit [Bacteroidales bacterium]|nr:3-isopropylmalate dehydratase small subunit [Bacteroidales bacterium]MDD3844529.1 3-isopropylmalate dehydratase small subunit [Bacteroidales bacterium]MDD4618313.1 3-isopropylmalate dehydratase small subunit [Bacteroidales bacterium]
MSSKKITVIESAAVLMPAENIDTDQIIPARFLKTTSREGFGANLFHDLRYNPSGEPNNEFVLNTHEGGCKILVAGHNFGCGSSREHAAWALSDYGFIAIVSSFFADIFRNNALNNGLLPVQVSEQFLERIFKECSLDKTSTLKIDLMKKEIEITTTKEKQSFQINSYKQECLIKGFDDIDYLLDNLDAIEKYEQYRVSAY